ncbi:MAG: GNAT superfamily N-acetyltransferase [Cocleimonas sp.]|jgi:GNAT superfamily N-acetyltransferase
MELNYRQASKDDLPQIIQMLVDDQLGSGREDPSLPINQQYLDAFEIINADSNNELIVLESQDTGNKAIVGILQLTYIPYLTYKGSWRCLIEGVRIHQDYRGKGLGTQLFEWAIQRAKQKDCNIVQLTSNKTRTEAIRFYESLGFQASHEGFKLFF